MSSRRCAALALGLAGLALAAGCSGGSSAPGAGPTAGPTTPTTAPTTAPVVVPWHDLRATYATIATARTHAPDPTKAVGPACRADDLTFHSTAGGAGGTLYDSVVARLRPGQEPCVVDGAPRVVAHTVDGHAITAAYDARDSSPWNYRHPVLVTRHASARLRLSWLDGCGGKGSSDLALALPGGDVVALRGYGIDSFCRLASPPEPIGTISELPWAPLDPHLARVRTPYDRLSFTAPAPATVEPGGIARLTFTVRTRHRIALSPCPDAVVRVGHRTHRYGLDCADVPTRAGGVPALLPGHPTTFALDAHAPGRTGPVAVAWWLAGTRPRVGFRTRLTVR